MDLIAYQNKDIDLVKKYIKKNYGNVPRIRGIRFMKLEEKVTNKPNVDVTDLFEEINSYTDYSGSIEKFNKYVGQDVIYIHTRCGNCGLSYDDNNSNYVSCGAKTWEQKYKNLFLEHITDPFDSTYCTHYFKAVIDDDYIKIVGDKNEK